jgi:hypothetical protein
MVLAPVRYAVCITSNSGRILPHLIRHCLAHACEILMDKVMDDMLTECNVLSVNHFSNVVEDRLAGCFRVLSVT